MAKAREAKDATGYSIGGVPPFGHSSLLPTVLDASLMDLDVVWAAGRPLAGEESRLQRSEFGIQGGVGICCAGQIIVIDQPGGAESALQPGVKRGAATRHRVRRKR